MVKGQAEHLQPSGHLSKLDKLLENRLRLGACVLLSDADAMSFSRLKQLLGATDGNLGAQLRKLEDARYLRANKKFLNRKPVTWYTLTSRGRRALQRHLDALGALIDAAKAI